MLQNLPNSNPLIDIPIQHHPDQINGCLAHNIRNSKIVVHDLVDAIKGVLFVHDGVQQDTQCPDVLFFSAVGLAGEDFGGGVIW